MSDAAPRTPAPAVGLFELLLSALAAGLLLGTAFGAWDLRQHAPNVPAADRLLVLLLTSAFALALVLPVVLVTALVLRLLGVRLSRGQWAGLLAGLVLLGLAAALVTLGSLALPRWLAPGVVLAALPAGALACGLLPRLSLVHRRGAPAALLAAGTLVVAALSLLPALRGSSPGALPSTPPPSRGGPPNVVLIVLDTTRRDHLGCYGSTEGLTPVLDAVAAGGVVYEDAYSAANWTVPSHASILTGLPPVTHGCSRARRLWLDDELVTLAEKLSERGYDTAAFYSNPWLGRTNVLQGFATRVDVMGRFYELAVTRACIAWGLPAAWIDKGAAQARTSLSAWLGAHDPSAPFFVFVNLLEAHTPYLPPRDERLAHLPAGVDVETATRFARTFAPRLNHLERRSDPRAAGIIGGLYSGGVSYQDRRLGELLDVLGRFSAADDTLLIVTADHGENIDDDGRWDHEFDANETLIHVPLIVRYPPAFPAGTRLSGLCELVDLAPTVEALVAGQGADGEGSLAPLLPATFTPRDAVHAQMYPLYNDFGPATAGRMAARPGVLEQFAAHWRVLRTGHWKYVSSSDGSHRLYDLSTDPLETTDRSVENPELAADLERRLDAWWEAQPVFLPRDGDAAVGPDDEEAFEKLKNLGYVR